MTPTTKDISLLTQRPELADKFDKVYGEGAAAKILAQAKPQAVPQRKEENRIQGGDYQFHQRKIRHL